MEIIRSTVEMANWVDRLLVGGRTIGLVPTMGYFHAGHLSLMRLAAQEADQVVVSLFVNPIQFGPQEDLGRYPHDFERDARLAAEESVAVLFAPTVAEMYPAGFQSRLKIGALAEPLCGRQRPGHFEGVATVVAKLFNLVRPSVAVFGEKDFQQLAIIRQIVRDLNWRVRIVGHPIVREADGLAMSSRNVYLSPEERESALCLHEALELARKRVRDGCSAVRQLKDEIEQSIAGHGGVDVEYINFVDQYNLTDKSSVDRETVLAMAIRVGRTRLIDNGRLFEGA
ncbi:MAG: pantoate--beta-alanine ligase [Deltaproteobacteria bacterium RIFOXYD12_FULL_57_12]|nr:MAG: pantoate--beta-alanine ligase [Deltaproteobacteria bacterium RIFOXYD12_FULL_57_12]